MCRCAVFVVPFCVDVTCRPQLALRALLVEDDRLEAAALLWHESSWETDRSLLRKKSLATLHSTPPKSGLLSPAKSVVGLQSVMQSPVGALIARALVVCHRYLPHVTRLPLCLSVVFFLPPTVVHDRIDAANQRGCSRLPAGRLDVPPLSAPEHCMAAEDNRDHRAQCWHGCRCCFKCVRVMWDCC